jgi:hypothetical protein
MVAICTTALCCPNERYLPMSPLSLHRLQELLKDDAELRRKDAEREARHAAACRPLREAVDEFWRRHGVLDPIADAGAGDNSAAAPPPAAADPSVPPPRLYQRPLPDSLFQSPLSEPRTTLVRYNRLPRPIQIKLGLADLASDAPDLVEIPRSLLEPGDLSLDSISGQDDGAAAHIASSSTAPNRRRPVQGNLTSKLSEYTRGLSGQARPFRPGGIGPPVVPPPPTSANESSSPDNGDHDEHLRAAVERSRRVLQIGSQAAWEEGGLLLTAPPGAAAAVSFKVGLSWKDVYGTEGDDNDEDGNEGNADEKMVDEEDYEMTSANEAPSSGAPRLQSAPLFSAAFLDDDSLFGSSSDEDDDDESGGGESDDDSTRKKDVNAKDGDAVASELVKAIAQLEVSTDADEVDGLLLDLSLTDPSSSSSLPKPTRHGAAPFSNPVELAERRARDQSDVHRKSWAHTELLPIRDWDATVPNPALTYPFALDDFQQQAIARLERSESVFVAAHTSAGKTVGTTQSERAAAVSTLPQASPTNHSY